MAPLAYQQCQDCRAVVHPRRHACPVCGSRRLDGRTSAGRGTVYSTTTVHRREGPHNVALVDLDEGFRVMSEVAGVEPDDVRIGMDVTAADDDDRIVFRAG